MSMKLPSLLALALLLLALPACRGAAPAPDAAARPSDCPLELLYTRPTRPFDELGEKAIQVTHVPPGGAPEALRPWGCALGADAIIVTRNQVVNLFDHSLVEGTAIKWTVAPPPAPEPEAPEPEAPAPPARSISL